MKIRYWVEEREAGDKLKKGTGIFCLSDADAKTFPYVVMTSNSVSALGELFCLCTERTKAEEIAKRLSATSAGGGGENG